MVIMKALNLLRFNLVFVITFVLSLTGCASLSMQVFGDSENQQHPSTEVANVPFFPQEELQCGPAALATVLNFEGVTVQPNDLTGEVFTPGREGTLRTDLVAGARRFGFVPYPIQSFKDLHASLEMGKPVLVLLNLSLPIYPQWHYAVVYGFKDGNYLLRSGQTREEVISEYTFENLWERSDFWGLSLQAPAQAVPEFATAKKWLDAAIGLERVNGDDALQAYSSGLARWPEDKRFAFALGNSFYNKNQKQLAAKFLRRAVEIDPQFADGWNNLAQVELELGDTQMAIQAIDKAIEIGGPRLTLYKANERKIKAAL